MQASQIPTKIPTIWAADAASEYVRQVPQSPTSQVGAASFQQGFPAACFLPESAGGVPQFGEDVNGIDQQITAWLQWTQAGMVPLQYDATFSAAIGGYPKGALLANASTLGLFWISTADNNTSDPDTGGANWSQFPQPAAINGQCKFSYQSATQCTLFPSGGSTITVNGQPVTIPSGGVNLTNSGLSGVTLYYVYAYLNSGTLTLTASTTGHVTASNGVEVMNGNAAYTLIGMVYTNGVAQFSAQGYGVLSWFNRRSQWLSNANTSGLQTDSSNFTSIGAPTIVFLTWSDEGVSVDINGAGINNTANQSFSTAVAIDGGVVGTGSSSESTSGNIVGPSNAKFAGALSEGAHTGAIYGKVSGGTGTWNGAQMFINVMG